MKRWGGKMKPDLEVSRWLLEVRKEPVEDAPLVVPKVVRQYTRKKKVPKETENKIIPLDVATVCSDKTLLNEQINIKEEIEGDNEESVAVISNIKKEPATEEVEQVELTNSTNASQSLVMCGSGRISNKCKTPNFAALRKCNMVAVDVAPNKTLLNEQINIKEEIEGDNEESVAVISNIKKEPATEEVEQVELTNSTNTSQSLVMCGSGRIPNKCKTPNFAALRKCNMVAVDVAPNKMLLNEEIDIKEEIEGDNEESVAVISNIKKEPSTDEEVEQVELTNFTNASQSLVMCENGSISNKCKTPNFAALRKCYMVAVDVAPTNSQQVVNPGNLAGLKVVAKRRIFTCDMCGKHFLRKSAMQNHIVTVHNVVTRYKCHCGAKFTHNYLLQAHMKSHTGQLVCDMCPKSFQSTTKLAYHLNTHLRERLFSCPICAQQYTVLANLLRHAPRHQNTDIFKCKSCTVSYRCIMDLKRHSEREHGHKVDFPCYVCSEILHSNAEFIAHVTSHDNALHECAFCLKRYVDFKQWEEHSAGHIERLDAVAPVLLPYVCSVCKKRFQYRSVLKTHMTRHTEERPYKCKECPKTFKTQSAVSEHQRGHERPYECAECAARFAKRDSLSRHLLLHSGERPHVCSNCKRAFTQRSAMLQHILRFHTPKLKFNMKRK